MYLLYRGRKNPFHIIFTSVALIMVTAVIFKPLAKVFYPVKYTDIIQRYTEEYSLDEHMIMAVISTESNFKKNAVSPKNAKGLMQLKEETALWCIERFGIDPQGQNIYSPELNINIGCAYLRYLTDKFQTTDTVLAAYNAGEGNVSRWLEAANGSTRLTAIPFKETKNYVSSVNNRTKIYKFLY